MKTNPSTDYHLEADGTFVIKNYNKKKPFSNFLPGIAGLFGTPLWAFYVNRGQGIASFGTKTKDDAILEFFPANKAYQMVGSVGFRTFIKYRSAGSEAFQFYEPLTAAGAAEQEMRLASYEFSLTDNHAPSGLGTKVVYFTVPEEPLAALARELTLTNHSKNPLEIEVLDGLPLVNPYGMNEFFTKQMSRTIEAWMTVENVVSRAPYFHLKVDATDRPEVTIIKEGNFYFSLLEEGQGGMELLPALVDTSRIFGTRLDFGSPEVFYTEDAYPFPKTQVTENKTPCAFTFARATLAPGKSLRILSFAGHARDIEFLNRYVKRAAKPGYFDQKRRENKRLISAIQTPLFTVSASPIYDLYCGQTFLDNVLRGGLPLPLTPSSEAVDSPVAYVYSRKHGDLERDYNRFVVEPDYFAQGNGNYRDINQNRRNDVWFEPCLKDANIRTFLNLIQLDGFNPLVTMGTDYTFEKTPASRRVLEKFFSKKDLAAAEQVLIGPFRLGPLYRKFEEKGLITQPKFKKFLSAVAPFLRGEDRADHGEGFWVDHWAYNLDLIESYLAIYPENAGGLFFGKKDYAFYDNDHLVKPRREKYHLEKETKVRQYNSVAKDKAKAKLLADREKAFHWVRTQRGKGSIYRTTLFVKLLCLFVNKIASMDAEGVGIEMEADKPSWYDALNGLPGLFGSSLPETFELKRLALVMIQALEEEGEAVAVPEELHEFFRKTAGVLTRHILKKGGLKNFDFWNLVSAFKEKYRHDTAFGVSGAEKTLSAAEIKSFLEHAREKIEIGIQKAFDAKTGLFPTYFENTLVRYKRKKSGANTELEPLQFKQSPLPFFLEGPVHAMKVEKDPQKRKKLLKAVRESGLYDRKLGMYKVNADMKKASLEIGRARVFAPGWLENESVFLHMEYKFLLEMLKAGLYEEFFEDIQKALVPFQPAERYGRSPLENSSFIASSAFVDEALHGTGFVARLSGSTAEFIHMWLLMHVGKNPFFLERDGKLALRLDPHLPGAFFTEEERTRSLWTAEGEEISIKVPKDSLAFIFLGKTLVVYRNPKRLNTYGDDKAVVRKISLRDKRGNLTEFRGDRVPAPFAARQRR